jgi:hypothetical protein
MQIDVSIEERINKCKSRRSNDIYLFSNVFSEDICNKLIDHAKKNAKYRLELGPHQNVRAYETSITKNDTFFFKHIVSKLRDINNYLHYKYNIAMHSGYKGGGNDIISLRKIYGPTNFHQDGVKPNPHSHSVRNLSVIIALNGDYDGGEIVFPGQNFKTKLKQGEAIAFPPYWTHPHYTEDLKNNTFRYTINTWITEDLR